jgi:hypothetical protein
MSGRSKEFGKHNFVGQGPKFGINSKFGTKFFLKNVTSRMLGQEAPPIGTVGPELFA